MKKLLILSILALSLISCGETVQEATMSFEIPQDVTPVDNSADITVAGERVELSGDLLKVWDTLQDVPLDHKADYFDQVSTGSLGDFTGYKLIETVPSLDTPVCTMQTKQLEFAAEQFSDIDFIVISNDTPFALQRFCSANGIDNMHVFSDARTREFGIKNGLMLPEYSLLTRSIMIVDENNTIQYIEYANEVTSELDLMNALAFLKNLDQ
jgi:thiol peroxidase